MYFLVADMSSFLPSFTFFHMRFLSFRCHTQWTTAHDFHHKEFFYNHGVVGAMDKALGTNGGETYAKWSQGILKRAFGK